MTPQQLVVRTAASDAGRDPMFITPAIWLFVMTGRTRDDVEEALSTAAQEPPWKGRSRKRSRTSGSA